MRKEKGITLVALIITIIIMLILVAVSVNILVKSNLIGTAEKAANGYKTAYEQENDGSITINGEEYSSIDEYIKNINSNIEMNYKIENGFIVVTALYKGEEPTDEDFEKYMRQQLEGKELPEKQQMLLERENFLAEVNGKPTFEDLTAVLESYNYSSWEEFVKKEGCGVVDQALINFGICPQYWWLIITLPDGTKKISSEPPLAPFEVRYAIKQTGKYEFKAEIFGEENSRSIIIRDENEIDPTIVEGNIEDWGYTEEDDGTITITKYLNTDTTIDTVVIPNYIDGKPVKAIRGETEYVNSYRLRYKAIWNNDICSEEDTLVESIVQSRYANENTSVHRIIVSEGIENISEYAFILSTGLTEVKLPSTLKYAGNYMFACCSEIKKIILPNSVTSIGINTFRECTSLQEITIPSSVTNIGESAFIGCTSLQEITIPSSVTSIEYGAFRGCTSLREITIPSSVTSIGEAAFYGCTSLQEITIPSRVTTMRKNVFFGIPSITVHVPWKEGEEKPAGWDDNWNSTDTGCTVTISYAK